MTQAPKIAPEALLQSPFGTYLCAHPRLVAASRDVAAVAANPTGAEVLIVVGPSGVGKTALVAYTSQIVRSTYAAEVADDPFRKPFVSFPLLASPSRGFRWHDYYCRGIAAAGVNVGLRPKVAAWERADAGGDAAQTAYLRMLDLISAKLVAVTNGAELLHAGTPWMLFRHWDHFGQLAEQSKVPHALVGDYRLLGLYGANPEHNARTRIVQFRRYGNSPEERSAFSDVVDKLAGRMRAVMPVNIEDYKPALHEKTVGAIGALVRWLHAAFVHAKRQKRPILNGECLDATAPSPAAVAAALDEVQTGEACVAAIHSGDVASMRSHFALDPRGRHMPRHKLLGISLTTLRDAQSRPTKALSEGK